VNGYDGGGVSEGMAEAMSPIGALIPHLIFLTTAQSDTETGGPLQPGSQHIGALERAKKSAMLIKIVFVAHKPGAAQEPDIPIGALFTFMLTSIVLQAQNPPGSFGNLRNGGHHPGTTMRRSNRLVPKDSHQV
jgi:hypothetical protein